jgi:hypothetical protein
MQLYNARNDDENLSQKFRFFYSSKFTYNVKGEEIIVVVCIKFNWCQLPEK